MDPFNEGGLLHSQQGVQRLGSEPLSIGTMELLAVVDLLEKGPENNMIILTDSAYVMLGVNRHSWGTRSLVRQCDRSLWLRAQKALG